MGLEINIQNVSKRFNSQYEDVLKNVSFTIPKNKKVGILGPNGAGKTTLISIICGLVKSTSGNIQYIHNDEIEYENVKPLIGLVPQEYAFYEKLTPIQNLTFFGALYQLPKEEIMERAHYFLKLLGLFDFKDKKVKNFSGGMKRRLNLAIGLIHNPEIVFLDEPTVGVDVQSKNAIMRFLEELNKKNVTIVYTSHHLNEAQHFCDHLILIDHGDIIINEEMKVCIANNEGKDLQTIFLDKTGGQLRDSHV